MAIQREIATSGFSGLAASAIAGSRALTVAAAGGTQATATAIVCAINVITTCTDAASGVLLPVNDIGDSIEVANATAFNLRVYPPVGGALSGATTNAPFTMAGNSAKRFIQTSALNYAV